MFFYKGKKSRPNKIVLRLGLFLLLSHNPCTPFGPLSPLPSPSLSTPTGLPTLPLSTPSSLRHPPLSLLWSKLTYYLVSLRTNRHGQESIIMASRCWYQNLDTGLTSAGAGFGQINMSYYCSSKYKYSH